MSGQALRLSKLEHGTPAGLDIVVGWGCRVCLNMAGPLPKAMQDASSSSLDR